MRTTSEAANRIGHLHRGRRARAGLTFPELLAVIILVGVLLLVATLSVYHGKAAADELACQDNMRAVHSALQIYWTKHRDPVTEEHVYPADQAAFEQFIQDRAYFPTEPRCPEDEEQSYHYQYSHDPASDPGPEGITITCPVADSGHGSL
jgi:prepilin-type N-terminal cleavage/methylation domain-containing protein